MSYLYKEDIICQNSTAKEVRIDWQDIPTVWVAVCIGGGILVTTLFIIAATVLPMLGIFGGIGWFLNKKSKEAKTLRESAKNWASTTGKIL